MKKTRAKKSLAQILLRLEMGILFAFLVIFLWQYFTDRNLDPVFANHYYQELAEYIIASFVISLGSSILVERLEREAEQNDDP